VKVVVVFLILIDTIMEENVITGIVIAGNIYNVMANGVKCPQCAVKDLCLKGKLGTKVQFDCASVHLEKVNIAPNKVDINILKKIHADYYA
jgi:hypothetical protein